MLSDELTVWGYIKVPYPYLDDFLRTNENLKGTQSFTDFTDFISPPIMSIGNAMLPFGFIYRYEENFEKVLINRFEILLKQNRFLFASLQIEIENKGYIFIEYVSDEQEIYKSINKILENNESERL